MYATIPTGDVNIGLNTIQLLVLHAPTNQYYTPGEYQVNPQNGNIILQNTTPWDFTAFPKARVTYWT